MEHDVVARGKRHILVVNVADAAIDVCLRPKHVAVHERGDRHCAFGGCTPLLGRPRH